jgi:hypothetical protein
MSVEAVVVVGDHDLGPVVLHELGQWRGGGVDGEVAERLGGVVGLPARHPRVVVPEELEVRDPKDPAALLELTATKGDDRLLVVAGVSRFGPTGSIAVLAVGARDEHGADALGAVLGEDASRSGRLVVGMGVDGHQRQRLFCHGSPGSHFPGTTVNPGLRA